MESRRLLPDPRPQFREVGKGLVECVELRRQPAQEQREIVLVPPKCLI